MSPKACFMTINAIKAYNKNFTLMNVLFSSSFDDVNFSASRSNELVIGLCLLCIL